MWTDLRWITEAAVSAQGASPAGCHLVEDALVGNFLDELAAQSIVNNEYDLDALDRTFVHQYGISR